MSPITRETLVARIATLEADSNISIKEGFYLQTMRLLLDAMDKPAPHHNGMMQLSNELASVKEALRRLSAFARSHAGDIQYTGDHPIAVAEKLAGQSFGNAEQLDTTPVQFESLAGDKSVSQPCNFPIEMTPEMMRAVQIGSELGAYAAANLSGAYGLFAEFWDVACRATGNSPVIPDGWINCRERMPEEGQEIIVMDVTRGEVQSGMIYQNGHFVDFNEESYEVKSPSHWMPLPAAPRQDVQSALKHGLKRYGGAMQKMAKREGKS